MNTIQLECFIAVAEHLNFSRASQALKITQPAVSHQIQSLEEELEVKLFRRTSKSVSLTQEGLQFLPDAELILKTAFSAKERLGRHESLIPLEIGCHDRMALELLPDLFHQLALEFPLLRPSVRMVPFPSLLGLVENQKISAAFDFKEGQKKSALRFKALSSAPIACVCTPDHPLAQYEVLTKDMLQGNLVVCSSRQVPGHLFSIQSRLIPALSPEQRYFTDNIDTAFVLVKAHLGYTLYPDVPQVQDLGLRYIPVRDLPEIAFGIYYRYDNDHPVMKRFLALAQEIFQPAVS